MLTETEYDRFVSTLYEAAHDRFDWQQWLGSLALAFDLWSAHIAAISHSSRQVEFFVLGGRLSAEANVDYLREYRPSNPQLAMVMAARPGRWIRCHEHFDDAYVEASPFYQDYLIPHGGRYLASTKLIDDAQAFVHFGTVRGVGQMPLDDEEIAWLTRICHHLWHAMMIRRSRHAEPTGTRLGATMLERLSQPVALVDSEACLRFTNPAASALFAEYGLTLEPGERMNVPVRDDADMLGQAIGALLDPARSSDGPARRRVLRYRLADGQPLLAIASVLDPATVMNAFGTSALVLLMFHRPGQVRKIDPVVVAEAFALTPAEARVAARLADGLSAEQIAAERRASLLTVRTQIRSILAKTGVRRQPELIRMLIEMPEVALPAAL